MSITDLFQDGLSRPLPVIAYDISRRLAQALPGKFVLESSDDSSGFRLDEYAAAGHCSAATGPGVHSQIVTSWEGPQHGLRDQPDQARQQVQWRGQTLETITVGWRGNFHETRWHWIVADDEATAREFFQAVCLWNSEVRGEVVVFSDGCWGKDAELFQAIQGTRLESLVLQGELKEHIRRDFEQFVAARDTYARYDVPWKRGVLLVGPPGNGKTHCVKSIINLLGWPCLYVRSFQAMHTTEQHCIQSVFHRARQSSPCLLVLEDLDSLLNDANRSYFLNGMDGFAANQGIITLATTNHPEQLDPAILDRPSRFDMKYYFGLPELAERVTYLGFWNCRLAAELQLTAD
ncbi:MAG: ATP-binding protein, partial [Pirellulales bacterium]